MSKNTKNKNYKRFLELRREEDELETQIKNLGYVELDKPVHHGYNAYYTLREDVVRRDDKTSFMYQYMIDNYANKPWSRKPVFYEKRKGYYIDNMPKFREITEKEYNEFYDWAKKYFTEHTRTLWGGKEQKYYKCDIPSYYLVLNIKNSYLTHEKVIDGELQRELAFVEDQISALINVFDPYGYSNPPKWFRQTLNRKDRRYNKMALKKNLNTNMPFNDSVEYLNYMLEIHRLENEYYGNEIHESNFKPLTKKEYYEDADWTDWASSGMWCDDPKPFRYQHRHNAGWLWW